jgi:tetratricopeptide (TPR) repeat protein
LTEPAARLFRLLSLHPPPDLAMPAAAALAGVPVKQARTMLAELTRAHLLTEHLPGRYAFHDLLRAYASEQSTFVDAADERAAALERMLDLYLHTAHAADHLLYPQRPRIALDPMPADVVRVGLTTAEEALAWFSAEYAVLIAAVELAEVTGFDQHVWRIAWILGTFARRRGHWRSWAAAERHAITAAERLGDPIALAYSYRGLARAEVDFIPDEQVRNHLNMALELYRIAGDKSGQGHVHMGLSWANERQRQFLAGLRHSETGYRLFREAGDRNGEAEALNNLAWSLATAGRLDEALAAGRRALDLLQETKNPYFEAHAWHTVASTHARMRNEAEAVRCCERAVALFREIGDLYHEGTLLAHLGDLLEATGDLHRAQTTWRQALSILSDLRHPDADAVRAKLATSKMATSEEA